MEMIRRKKLQRQPHLLVCASSSSAMTLKLTSPSRMHMPSTASGEADASLARKASTCAAQQHTTCTVQHRCFTICRMCCLRTLLLLHFCKQAPSCCKQDSIREKAQERRL
jgi:hypothetical protein